MADRHLPERGRGQRHCQGHRLQPQSWEAYSRYAESGHLPLGNNGIENCLRPIAVGKKNRLFAGPERGGRHAAVIYSLLIAGKTQRAGSCGLAEGHLREPADLAQ